MCLVTEIVDFRRSFVDCYQSLKFFRQELEYSYGNVVVPRGYMATVVTRGKILVHSCGLGG